MKKVYAVASLRLTFSELIRSRLNVETGPALLGVRPRQEKWCFLAPSSRSGRSAPTDAVTSNRVLNDLSSAVCPRLSRSAQPASIGAGIQALLFSKALSKA